MVNLRPLLREAKDRGKAVVAIGVYDAGAALHLTQVYEGLKHSRELDKSIHGLIVYVSGYLVSSTLGKPDMAVLDRTHAENATSNIAEVVSGYPVGTDIDTGFGNTPYTVRYAARRIHRAGANYVQIEDQAGDKSCGHMKGSMGTSKEVMDLGEFVNMKLKPLADYAASKEARAAGHDFLVMARTDSAAVHGMDDAILRVRTFNDYGAEILFLEAPGTVDDLARAGRMFRPDASVHMLANMIEGGKTPYRTIPQLAEMGFTIPLYCVGSRFASDFGNGGMLAYFTALLKGKNPIKEGVLPPNAFEIFNNMIGRVKAEDINRHYAKQPFP